MGGQNLEKYVLMIAVRVDVKDFPTTDLWLHTVEGDYDIEVPTFDVVRQRLAAKASRSWPLLSVTGEAAATPPRIC